MELKVMWRNSKKRHGNVPCVRVTSAIALLALTCFGAVPSRETKPAREVVVYTALDQFYSEPILKRFEKETGIVVRPRYDTEATKTTGLFNRVVAERGRPRCDVFWNNEVLRTVALKRLGLLQAYTSPSARDIPDGFKDRAAYWAGFAARARVIVFNTNLLTSATAPHSIFELAQPPWRRRTAMSYPLFGTMATHGAALFAHLGNDKARSYFQSLRDNEIQVLDGNALVVRTVARGELAAGLTDTDDVYSAQLDGKPVAFILPDQRADEIGALVIPNTLGLIRDCPHPDAGKRLMDFLLDPSVENELAAARSAQIPVRPNGALSKTGIRLDKIRMMPFDYEKAATAIETSTPAFQDLFAR
jgi:iron(III) transport system substrate-binding protein